METITMSRRMRRPGTFWRLVFDDEHLRHVEGRSFYYPEFDYLRLIQGQPFDGLFPPGVRLWIGDGQSPLADQLGNPLGWTIMCDRLVEYLWPMIKDCVQAFPAPLYKKHTDIPVPGYQVLNIIRVLDCVDLTRSTPWHDARGTLGGFNDACIDPTRTLGAHMFKYVIPPDGIDFGVTCSYELVKSLEGKGFTGISFLRCRCKDER